jgi:membrane fusion protein (multidrug efflux system)
MNQHTASSGFENQIELVSSDTIRKQTARKTLRKKLLMGLAAGVVILGTGYYLYDVFIGSRYVWTDNAYVGADTAEVTPLIAGPVKEVRVSDTARVAAGDVLVVLDDSDAKIALTAAEAALAQAQRRVRGYFANDKGYAAQVSARAAGQAKAAADLIAAQSNLDRARVDLERRKALAASGAVSGEELTSAQNIYAKAEAALAAARASERQASAAREAALGTLDANAALTQGTTVETNPEVEAARARVEQARLDLSRTVIRAPVAGVVVKRQVQVGQRVQAGNPVMRIVPIAQAYVDANFKEVQLTDVHAGQKVELHSDLYGSDVTFHGHVVGLSGGTGSSFALIPAQNATGNWIKVVQRVPVRIAIDADELNAHPLRTGLSMTASIDTRS